MIKIEIVFSDNFFRFLKMYASLTGTSINSTIVFFITNQVSNLKAMQKEGREEEIKEYIDKLKSIKYRKLSVKESEHRKRKTLSISEKLENELYKLAKTLGYSRNELIRRMLDIEKQRLFPEVSDEIKEITKNTRKTKISIPISTALKGTLQDISNRTEMPVNNIITHILVEYLLQNYNTLKNIELPDD